MTPHEGPEPPAATPFWKRRRWQAAGGALLALLAAFLFLTWALPLGRALEPLSTPTLVLTDSDGRPFARRGAYKEAPVEVKELPGHVTGAFLAIEDRRFYSHFGLDLAGIARAARDNLRAGGVAQGGSTITQQLAKNAFLSNERSWRRKAQEALIALYLEARLSKDEIFSRYLSAVYFGDGVFGLRAAARHYFDKEPEALSIGEAAMLAGLVKAPSRLAPTEDLAAARARARVVLAAMVETGVISEAQARAARNVRLREGRADLPVGTYFADWITREARRGFDRAFGEIEARTTLDSRLQSQAERIVERALARQGGALNAGQAALVAMRTDGRVVAMVGGRDYAQSQFNRAVDAQRQPGSAFKLFVYQAAIRQGWTPDREILDAPVKVGDWEPENHEARYAGRPISLRRAFAGSSNVAAVRLAREVGTDPIIRAARDMGVSAPLTRDLTLALGTSPMSLLELTAAYAAVAAGEAPIRPYGLAGRAPAGERRVLPAGEREALRDLLRAVVTQGTGRAAGVSGAHGKTGTTQDYRDALFVGYAGDLVVGVWIGNDDNSPMRRAVGGGLPAQIWRDFVAAAQPLCLDT
ncbi:MAG: transglycosylase domain-containing protein [Phenylobacterium sp.]|uniref:transglycosylase domain-containing protein n=1 Tax=Phenylobacterium sp. TaxID=1871053 RepID=UPI00391B3EFF